MLYVGNKPIIIYGAGQRTKSYLKMNVNNDIVCVIDSDKNKSGTQLCGVEVKLPEEIENLADYFVVINMKYHVDEVSQYLESRGLLHGRDYAEFDECYLQIPDMISIQESLAMHLLKEDLQERFEIVRSKQEYEMFCEKCRDILTYEKCLASMYYRMPLKMGHYRGYCAICEKMTDMGIRYDYAQGEIPCWSETVRCMECGVYCRTRMAYEILSQYKDKKVYINEKKTLLYRHLEKVIPNLTGSEFLGGEIPYGEEKDGIRNEDATRLTFLDASFDIIASFDCYEHIYEYEKCFREAYRCLKHGGKFIFSVPMNRKEEKNVKRAIINSDGRVTYLLKPCYHDDPLNENGCLVYNDFGWQIIDDLRSAGFEDAYAVAYFSVKKGYLGNFPVFFIADKL